jgi:hypothetical protein
MNVHALQMMDESGQVGSPREASTVSQHEELSLERMIRWRLISETWEASRQSEDIRRSHLAPYILSRSSRNRRSKPSWSAGPGTMV